MPPKEKKLKRIAKNSPKSLPEKPAKADMDAAGGDPGKLKAAAKKKYDDRKKEESRRKDKDSAGVASEAVEFYHELMEQGRSPSEVFTDPERGGYSLSRVLKPALADEQRILADLAQKPSADVEDGLLKVVDIQTRHEVPEWTPPPEPIPE